MWEVAAEQDKTRVTLGDVLNMGGKWAFRTLSNPSVWIGRFTRRDLAAVALHEAIYKGGATKTPRTEQEIRDQAEAFESESMAVLAQKRPPKGETGPAYDKRAQALALRWVLGEIDF